MWICPFRALQYAEWLQPWDSTTSWSSTCRIFTGDQKCTRKYFPSLVARTYNTIFPLLHPFAGSVKGYGDVRVLIDCWWRCGQSVDYGRMAEILVLRAGAHDAFTRLTSITWVRFFHSFTLEIRFAKLKFRFSHQRAFCCVDQWVCEAGRWSACAVLLWYPWSRASCYFWRGRKDTGGMCILLFYAFWGKIPIKLLTVESSAVRPVSYPWYIAGLLDGEATTLWVFDDGTNSDHHFRPYCFKFIEDSELVSVSRLLERQMTSFVRSRQSRRRGLTLVLCWSSQEGVLEMSGRQRGWKHWDGFLCCWRGIEQR